MNNDKNKKIASKEEEMDEEEFEDDDQEDDDDNDDMDGSEDDDDDDDDDDEDDEQEMGDGDEEKEKIDDQTYQTKLSELENVVAQNKFDYQTYVDIINLAKNNADFNKLREFRQKMSEVFPLTESLWLDWIKDEIKYVEDRSKVIELFEKAVQDYLSVDIWFEYIQFTITGMGEANGIEKVREICERAVSLAGLHVNKGHFLWGAYRDFEFALLAGYQQSLVASVQTPEQIKQLNEQTERVMKIFRRQISICLSNLENTVEDLKQFDETKYNDEFRKLYESSYEKYRKIEPFEVLLLRNESDATAKLIEYRKYIEFELNQLKTILNSKNAKNQMNESELNYLRKRLKCLFERAIADNSNCLDASLWLDYIYYLNEEEHNEENVKFYENVVKRSIRNCTWSSKLWITHALLLENNKASIEEIKATYNQAMNAGLQTSEDYLQLWHAYLDYLRRIITPVLNESSNEKREEQIEDLRDTFQKAINQQFDYFKNNGDPTFSLEKYWALVEAKFFKNMEKSRKIYNEMILNKGNNSKYLSEWLEFYDLEKQFGDEKHQRKLLNRSLNELVNDSDKEYVCDLIYKFEKLNGNASQYKNAFLKLQQIKDINLLKLAEKNQSKEQFSKTNKKFDNKNDNKKPQEKKAGQTQSQQVKSKDTTQAPKKNVENGSNLKRKNENEQQRDSDGFAIPSLPTEKKTEEPSAKKPKNDSTEPLDPNLRYSDKTVFISNISFDLDEEKIIPIFEKEPGFKGIRLIKHWSGKNKGYGYVDFETSQQAANALKLDRSPIDGRPLFVSKNVDKSLDFGQQKFKYASNLEKTKLFVSGLPFSTDKEALEEIFKTFGKLKEVRIVTYKNGKSKGLAYVEFEDEPSASKALLQTDGMLIGEHQIAVAISNPPKRKQPFEAPPPKAPSEEVKKSLGAGSVTNRNQPSTSSAAATSFVPRSQLMNVRKKTLNLK